MFNLETRESSNDKILFHALFFGEKKVKPVFISKISLLIHLIKFYDNKLVRKFTFSEMCAK